MTGIADLLTVARARFDLGVAMDWRHVLFDNRPADPAVVEAHLPEPLTVDTYDGDAWLSVVPFTNLAVRPPWLPRLAGFPLPELNLRTYVTCDGIPGVYFFSLDADGILGVAGARLFHHLPYYYADIDMTVSGGRLDARGGVTEDTRIHFESRRYHPGARPVIYEATYGPTGEAFVAESGSLADFLTERYRYYTEAPDGTIRYANVHHEQWPLYEATVDTRENTIFRANGFAEPDGDPVVLYSPAVDTTASASRERGHQ